MHNPRRLPTVLALLALAALVLPAHAAEAEKYLPNNSDAVITINVKMLLDSAIGKKVLEMAKQNLQHDAGAQKILEAIGVDPFKDIDLVLIGSPGGNDPDKALAVIQGKFDPSKIQAVAAKAAENNADNLKIEKVGTINLYTITPPGKNQKVSYAALLDEKVLVGSANRESVVEAIDKKAGKVKPELKKALTELMAKSDSKQAITVAVTEGAIQGRLAGQAKSVTGGLTVTEDIKLDFNVNAKDEKAANGIADELKEGLNFVKALVDGLKNRNERYAPLAEIVDTLSVKADASTVAIKGEISKSVLEKAEKLLKGLKPKSEQ